MVKKYNKINSYKPPAAGSGFSSGGLMSDMAAVSETIDSIFASLQAETESFSASLVGGFHDASKILEDILQMILKSAGGSGAGGGGGGWLDSLLGFIPGGNILGGIFDLFTGAGSSVHSPAASGSELNYLSQPAQMIPNINITIESEVEKTRAVKFLTNYMPVYNTRSAGSEV